MLNNLNEILQPMYNKLHINSMEYVYNKENKMFISKDPIFYDNDIAPYNILIKIHSNIGSVVTAIFDQDSFYENEFLGQIKFNGTNWELL